jgi:hypothetical protein
MWHTFMVDGDSDGSCPSSGLQRWLTPSPTRPCIGAVWSSGHRGLLAHWLARRGIESPIARRRSVEHRLTHVADLEGAPFRAKALPSVS